jgi:hypothetical protein
VWVLVAHLRAVPDPDDDPTVDARVEPGAEAVEPVEAIEPVEPVEPIEPVDPAAAVAPGEDEAPAAGEHPVEASEEEPRRYPSTIGGAFYVSILAAAGVALVIASRSDWRLGIKVLGVSLIVAALLRLVLANRDAGMLAVRNRFIDAFLLGGAGAALVALATSIRDMPVT